MYVVVGVLEELRFSIQMGRGGGGGGFGPLEVVFSGPLLMAVLYAILPAFDAILGHRSAHSFETGPVIAEPFISPLLLTMTPALSSK